jgi:hypothetical protein
MQRVVTRRPVAGIPSGRLPARRECQKQGYQG